MLHLLISSGGFKKVTAGLLFMKVKLASGKDLGKRTLLNFFLKNPIHEDLDGILRF